jgi:hypothetical protein
MADHDKATIEAFLESKALDRTADYVRRGRAFSGLGTADLEANWAEAFRQWAACNARGETCNSITLDDLLSEIGLRQLQPPLHLVRAEFDMLKGVQDEQLSDPDVLQKKGHHLTAELDAFVESIKQHRRS